MVMLVIHWLQPASLEVQAIAIRCVQELQHTNDVRHTDCGIRLSLFRRSTAQRHAKLEGNQQGAPYPCE